MSENIPVFNVVKKAPKGEGGLFLCNLRFQKYFGKCQYFVGMKNLFRVINTLHVLYTVCALVKYCTAINVSLGILTLQKFCLPKEVGNASCHVAPLWLPSPGLF